MTDKPPLLFKVKLGSLKPANAGATAALKAYGQDELLRVRITRASGNTRRNGLYWACLSVFCENMGERLPGATPKAMHRKLKRDLDLATPIVSAKTGEVIEYDYDSTSFDSMPEHERSEFVTAALGLLASWLGCTVEELRREGQIDS